MTKSENKVRRALTVTKLSNMVAIPWVVIDWLGLMETTCPQSGADGGIAQ